MKYFLVIQTKDLDEFSVDALADIEDELSQQLGSEHEVDGHDVGSGEINFFINTNDPIQAFNRIKSKGNLNLQKMTAAYRLVDGEQYTIIWPESFEGTFEIK